MASCAVAKSTKQYDGLRDVKGSIEMTMFVLASGRVVASAAVIVARGLRPAPSMSYRD